MATDQNKFQAIISHCKEYGFVFQSSEIYDGLSAVYDYGQNGAQLKKNIRDYWWKSMTQMHENIVGIDSAIFMHPTIWKASGHVDGFSDPMIDNKDSKKRYRVDHLIEAHAETLPEGNGDVLISKMNELLAADDLAGLKTLIETYNIQCAVSKTANWTDVRQFNLMFSTQLGSVTDEASEIYLRPETAQGIFVNFLNVQKTGRMKIPFGIAQVGKAFRNEIVARQFIFRMREFEQMEMQFFVRPGTQKEWFAYWKEERLKWHKSLGIDPDKYRFHVHDKLAFYADAAEDIEYEFPIGFKEVEGIHSRTDHDLSRHQEFSRKKMQYFDTEINQNYIPYVIETSIGLDRMFLLTICDAYVEEDLTKDGKEDSRVVMKLPAKLAPVKLAIFPLTKKDGLPEIGKELMDKCKSAFHCFYEEKDAIGRRYRRQDAIGTPFCVTIDHQTKEDGTVTIRYRDNMEQERIPMDKVKELVLNKINE
ncbi:glycine--tRNA ligase [Chitinophaga pinensis]|uniref:Glycine--tRNA ligase n=1 Tax=Chitinophaga pinensis (strain ATCC 43595 / DSM 2588 / LMG 13176 / NBRC 15968 / NCIMB 11800 / UQM 2034) TaxID=485918 RepID=A0A979FZA3_CHIPD|nr:glycine--tRNA ligase [Chitinophaga pinensis]ACU57909.1 glycyl-tRNA synthetase [Chitinophaga pinensis DSM 2588]